MPATPLEELAGVAGSDRTERCAELVSRVESLGLHSIRVCFVDVHGLLRGKTIRSDLLAHACRDGIGITSALLLKDTGQNNVYPVWESGAGLDRPWLTGAGDVMMLPDPATFRVLPWSEGSGLVLSDLYSPGGEPVELSTRRLCAMAEESVREAGFAFKAGLEVEFHFYRVAGTEASTAAPPTASQELDHSHPGRMYLAEQRYDTIEPFLEKLRSNLTAMGMAPRSLEIELGPSQAEITFDPAGGLEVADQAVVLRSAVKQIAHRNGFHATFMSRPGFAQSFSSGWHLHQSLVDRSSGRNVFAADDERLLSEPGEHYVAGLLAHAEESCLLTTPTVTGYKRYRAESLAPDRIAWAAQHRGAMLRVVGAAGDPSTRVENRVGDSAANPYLYVLSQMQSGLAGLRAASPPPAITESPYVEEAGPTLPRTLADAIESFSQSDLYRCVLGERFVAYYSTLKQAEWDRFMSSVTDWEQTEYLDLF